MMTSTQATEAQWDQAHDKLEREFPACDTWLTWWSQPWVASMAFPAKSKVSRQLREQVPSTSNPIEHQHSLLNQACGSKHDLVAGVLALLKHIQERAALYYVCESELHPPNSLTISVYPFATADDGWDPPDPKSTRSRKRKRDYTNDGKPPRPDKRSKTNDSPPAPEGQDLVLFAYKWLQPNSCFFDHTLEILYRLWINDQLMSPRDKEKLRTILPTDAFWNFLGSHYDRRQELSTGPFSEEKAAKLIEELARGQAVTKEYIFETWEFLLPGDYGCSISWLHHAVRVRTLQNPLCNVFAIFIMMP